MTGRVETDLRFSNLEGFAKSGGFEHDFSKPMPDHRRGALHRQVACHPRPSMIGVAVGDQRPFNPLPGINVETSGRTKMPLSVKVRTGISAIVII